jgi:transcriptional regulator with XRE-family HTH domain
VAKRLGVTEATIWNWEAHRSTPQLTLIPKVIVFLGCDTHSTQPMSLGERLVAYRRAAGVSQRELAQRLGIDPGTLGRWEREKGRPSCTHLRTVMALLEQDTDGERVSRSKVASEDARAMGVR